MVEPAYRCLTTASPSSRKLAGIPLTPNESATAPRLSIRTGNDIGNSCRNFFAMSVGVSTHIATTENPSPKCFFLSVSIAVSSSRHETHHGAQKTTSTTSPLKSARLNVFPCAVGNANPGAGEPMRAVSAKSGGAVEKKHTARTNSFLMTSEGEMRMTAS